MLAQKATIIIEQPVGGKKNIHTLDMTKSDSTPRIVWKKPVDFLTDRIFTTWRSV